MLELLPKVRGTYRENFKLANVTWFGVGGPADILFKPADQTDLAFFLRENHTDIPYMILGVGSNLLVREGGISGVVIRLGKGFTEISHKDNILEVGAGALDTNVSTYCLEHNLTGLEFLSGIPGVIGGAVAMNAGAYGQETSDHLIKVEALDSKGNFIALENNQCGFKYRSNSLNKDLIFTKAYFKVSPGEHEDIKAKIQDIQQKREESQPIRNKTGGSTFKNPTGYKAWELIDKAGCRGLKEGDAIVSEKHCNFLINLGSASADDLETLGENVRQKVYDNSGVKLEWEIKIVGRNKKS